MSFFQTIFFFFILAFTHLSKASPEKKLPSAVVVGTVYCDTCFQDDFSKSSHFISGASVAVECKDGSFRKEVKTDNHGEFKVHLPFSISKHVKKIEGCSVKLISSSEPYCAVASTATSSSLHLKSRKQGIHIFSAGFFTFKPLKQPNLCNQKPSIENSKGQTFKKEYLTPVDDLPFPPPIQDQIPLPGLPPFQFLPPLPMLPPLPPLPTLPLPPLPPLPGVPGVPPSPRKIGTVSKPTESSKKAQLVADKKVAHPEFFVPTQVPALPLPPIPFLPPPLIPNPLQPPPLLPNPLQPPPLLPNPLQPPPAPLLPLPPIPGLTPSQPPPSLPFPFPPLIPFPPIVPRIPGTPPAFSSTSSKHNP